MKSQKNKNNNINKLRSQILEPKKRFLTNKKEILDEEENINLRIAKRIIQGGVFKNLDIKSKLGKTKQSYYKYLDEARDYYKKKINELTIQLEETRQKEKKFRAEGKNKTPWGPDYKKEKQIIAKEKNELIKIRRREVYDLKKFIKTGDLIQYMKPRIKKEKNPDIIEFTLFQQAMKGVAKRYRSNGPHFKFPNEFFEEAKTPLFKLIREELIDYKVRLILHCKMVKLGYYDENPEGEFIDAHFSSNQEVILKRINLEKVYDKMKEKIFESLAVYQKRGSGWAFHHIELLEVVGSKYKPLKGSSYIPTLKKLGFKKAIINPKNSDQDCFVWAVLIALYSLNNKNPGRITKFLRNKRNLLCLDGIEFPVALTEKSNNPFSQVDKFERQNSGVHINIFGHNGDSVYPLRINKDEKKVNVRLLLLENRHFTVIKSKSRLLSSQISTKAHSKFICDNCLNAFGRQDLLDKHRVNCKENNSSRMMMPKKGSIIEFKNQKFMQKLPFIIYADFECLLKPVNNKLGDSTVQYQKHDPCGFSYYIKCIDNEIYKPKQVTYTKKNDDEDISKKFVEMIEAEMKDIYQKHFRFSKPIKLNKSDLHDFNNATYCYVCKEQFLKEKKVEKVQDHCHFPEKYRGAAHSLCNQKLKKPKFILIVFHNLEGYDSHLIIKSLGLSEGEISCIAKTDEKYISFSKNVLVDTFNDKKPGKQVKVFRELRFLDSFKFLSSSLANLVNNLDKSKLENLGLFFPDHVDLLSRKGVYPYDYINSLDRLNETKLPSKSKFYSKLSKQHICDKDYKHAQKVWKILDMTKMRDYHDLYLKTDVLLLADVFKNFRKMSLNSFEIDPPWVYTSPGLSWEAMLKYTKVKIELITDPDMYMMIEKGVHGGLSLITKRYAVANNKYLKNYNPKKPSVYLPYLDANNLYGGSMMKKLPLRNFRRMTLKELLSHIKNLPKSKKYGYIYEVDLEYPKHLHNSHSDYPLAPEKIKINGVEKLNATLKNKSRYVLHHEALKFYLDQGLVLKKIHRGIKFEESDWMRSYIEFNTKQRQTAKTKFEKDFFKLLNNSIYGKTLQNIRDYSDVKLVKSKEKAEKLFAKPNFKPVTIFDENLIAVQMYKTSLVLNKPKQIGMTILDHSKITMYNFHYNYIKPKFADSAKLLFTDTDSLCYEISDEDYYEKISPDLEEWFDTSEFNNPNIPCIKPGLNKKVPGKMKDEICGGQITQFVGLRPKCYTSIDNSNYETKKANGVSKSVIQDELKLMTI